MSALRYLYLHDNSLSGTLPPPWGNMTAMQRLYLNISCGLDGNNINGTLPFEWGESTSHMPLPEPHGGP